MRDQGGPPRHGGERTLGGCGLQALAGSAPPCDRLTPADRYQELFVAVQGGGVFDDSKSFVDCAPLHDPALILARYRSARHVPGFDLSAFVHAHFQPPLTEPDREVLTALARTEERRPEQRVEVTFLPEAGDGDDPPQG